MRRDLVISFVIVLSVHVGFAALWPKPGQKHATPKDETPLIKIDLPPPPPPDEPDDVPPETDAPLMAPPPSLVDMPTNVPIDAFVTPIEPPPPAFQVHGAITMPVSHNDFQNVKIFNLSDLDQQPVPQLTPQPHYPEEMNRQNIEGTVTLGFVCDAEGHVQNPYVVKSSGFHELDEAAVQAITKWQFKPGRKGGHAVNTHIEIPIAFTLTDNGN